MSAEENLSGPQFYHASRWDFEPGKRLEGGTHKGGNFAHVLEHVYYAQTPHEAAGWGEYALPPPGRSSARLRVYQVAPEGEPEPDPNVPPGMTAWRSRAARVVGEVPGEWEPS